MTVAFLETTADHHAFVVGGLTALERRVRDVAKAGATRAVIATEPIELSRPMPIPIQFVPPGSPAPHPPSFRVRDDERNARIHRGHE